jgi:hypothetical protein
LHWTERALLTHHRFKKALERIEGKKFETYCRIDAGPALHPLITYFVIIRLGAVLGVCSAGDMTKVTQAFQPSGRLSWANSQ